MEPASFGEVFNFGVLHMEWPTATFIFVVFVITLFLLNSLLFQPLLRTLEAREQVLTGSDDRLGEIEKELGELQDHYLASLHKSQLENEEAHQAALKEASAQASNLISAARTDSTARLTQAEAEVAQEMDGAYKEAKDLAKGLAEMIQNKVLAS
ncbi:MAG: ATP synthase F0 subunit B [bacterium]|nr:ATP synthase F0 subunit B [bacterium]